MTAKKSQSPHSQTFRHVWATARMYIAFHLDQSGGRRDAPRFWSPKNGCASLHRDPKAQEVVLVLKAAEPGREQGVEVKLHPNRIIVRRDAEMWWQGVAIEEDTVRVQMADGTRISVGYDGRIKREADEGHTHVEADGSVFKRTRQAVVHVTGDGVEMKQRTEDRIVAITADGVVDRARKR
ncbi:hypothetical protein [Ruegeria halocynthiae]|uniref:hypothetical protein n=1 Tax=Ruegeria halocynthiae TaxID=985054 RepID=UPI0012694EAB|nr:hypothetical protein [Ruegeria halocynthiae]